VALQELGRLEEALGVCGEAVGRHPEFAEAHYNLGRIYQDLERHGQAVEAFQRALVLRPDYAQAHNNLAISLHALGRVEEAVREYECAIDADPAYDDPRVNLGMALRDVGRLDEAVAHYRGLLGVRPDLTEARWNLGHILLLKGDWEEGFEMAEARRQIPRLLCNRTFARPEWRGEDPGGRTILLHAEQGFGDSIQFFRYARLVRRRGARVILLCQGGLKRLLEGQSGVDEVVAEGDPLPDFDLHCPLLTLPVIFRTTPATVPHDVPYIDANPSLVARWASRMEPLGPARKIGLAWAGNPRQADDRTRSMPAEALEPLARVRNARFISLQKPRPMKGIVPASLDLIDFTDELSDFADTAAVMQNLDLIVTVDTSVSHLAGALGRPVWTMLSKTADWRYLLGREDSPWYPTMRLFRQTELGEWWKVVERIVGELE
jgi:tetratricopeptide repeat protein/glycosyl transferase family 9 (putative heptosyltransferase)